MTIRPNQSVKIILYANKSQFDFCFQLSADNIEHMLIKEVRVKLNNPSDAETDYGTKELMIAIDGETFHLHETDFSLM